MIVFGLTGSIGMGKSRAAAMLRRLGVPVHDSDKAVHEALEPKGAALAAVAAMFPAAYDRSARRIDRKKLGDIVFADPAERRRLEAVLHPAAQAAQKKFLRAMKARGKKAAALEIPLLFETGADDRVDFTICVTAPKAIQRRRVLARKNMTEKKFEQIVASQMPDADKRKNSDFVVQTGLGQAHTFQALKKILSATGVR